MGGSLAESLGGGSLEFRGLDRFLVGVFRLGVIFVTTGGGVCADLASRLR